MARPWKALVGIALLMLIVGTACSDDDDVDQPRPRKDIGHFIDVGDDANNHDDADVADTSVGPELDTSELTDVEDDVVEPVPMTDRGFVIGHSVEGRPIVAERFGSEGPVLYILSAIHGNERSSVTFGERFRAPLLGGLAERMGVQIFYLPTANPDGVFDNTRGNANGVDCNRNFPADNFQGGIGGPYALSEPESEAIHESILAVDPTAILSLHCCYPVMDWDGPGEELARAMGDASDFPAYRIGSRPGSLGSWAGETIGIPIITVEFSRVGISLTDDEMWAVERAVEAAMVWTRDNGVAPTGDPFERLQSFPSPSQYTARELGTSASGGELRIEQIGDEDSTTPWALLVSGVSDNRRMGLHLSEHIRRALLSQSVVEGTQVAIVTAANPDGILDESTLNAAQIDVAADFAIDASSSPEVQALRDLIESRETSLVILVEAGDGEDRVELFGLLKTQVEAHVSNHISIVERDDLDLGTGDFLHYLRSRQIKIARFVTSTNFAMGDQFDGTPAENIEIFSLTAQRLLNDATLR
ncbi:MAG: hypothetical protein H0U74_01200 [Bradymonadaceae bacterium]|nr:hypothetical protein [Lujinxingiaceae bacterium]